MRAVSVVFVIVMIVFGIVVFTHPRANVTYQSIYFISIGLPVVWKVVQNWKKKKTPQE